jgi:uncharacterized RDD family membrane protein YckC
MVCNKRQGCRSGRIEEESLNDQRYAPPTAHVEDVPTSPADGTPQLATRTRRFWASMLDMGIAVIAIFVLQPLLPWDVRSTGEGFWTVDPAAAAGDFFLFVLLHGWLLLMRGQTIGKAILGLRIVRPDGGKPSAFQLLASRNGLFYALMVVPAIGLLVISVDCLMIFRSSRRCLHDLLAGTIVVKA